MKILKVLLGDVNPGTIAVQAAMEFWSPENRARRKKRRAARKKIRRGEVLSAEEEMLVKENEVKIMFPNGREIIRTEPTIKARTSTKMTTVGAALLATTAAAVIPNWSVINDAIMEACQSKQGPAVGLGLMALMLGVNALTTRFTKSPAEPGKI